MREDTINIINERKIIVKDYKVGDVYGYRYEILYSSFNPYFPGRAPVPKFSMDVHAMLKGKQTFYGLAIIPVIVEGLLTTKDEVAIPMQNTWDGWVELDETDVYAFDYEKAVENGMKELKICFERKEKFNK